MKVNDVIRNELGDCSMETRTKVVNRLLRLGYALDTEVSTADLTTVKNTIKRASVPADDAAPMQVMASATAMPVYLNADRCPVCHGSMVEGMLHTGQKTPYCPKCRVVRAPQQPK